MRIAILALLGLIASVGYVIWKPADQASIDSTVFSSLKTDETDYAVSNIESGTVCLITRGKLVSARSRDLRVGADCRAVWPGLADTNTWIRNDDGTVALADDSGKAVLTLAMGDGIDFESLEPANAVLAFQSVE